MRPDPIHHNNVEKYTVNEIVYMYVFDLCAYTSLIIAHTDI